MGDDADYDDDYGYMFDDPDYIYAEESWDLADELAGNALPQPLYLDDLEDLWGDYDMYDYFEEIEFGNDDYFDREDPLPRTGDKRKGEAGSKEAIKQRRIELVDFDYTPVLWMPIGQAYGLDKPRQVDPKTLTSYALLPDWRVRLKDSHGFAIATETRPESAYSHDAEMDDGDGDAEGDEHDERDWEDEEDEEEEEVGDKEHDMNEDEDEDMEGGLDPEVLKRILAAKLAESGIGDADPEAFLQSIMKMMQGDGGDEALEELTSVVLGNASEGGDDSATTKWLSQQGVSLLQEEEEGEDGASNSQAPTSTTKTSSSADTDSPIDSVVGPEVAKSENLRQVTEPLPPTSIPQDAGTGKKRKNVSFAPPNDRSFSKKEEKNGIDDEEEDEEELALSSQPASKRPRNGKLVQPPKQTTGKLKSIKSRPGASKYRPNNTVRSSSGPTEKLKVAEKKTDPEAAPATAMSELKIVQKDEEMAGTRKRKAPPQESDATEEKPKRQLRNFAAPTASSQRKTSDSNKKPELAKKSTRSSREKK